MAGIVAHGWSRLAPMERLPDGARIETGPGGLERLTLAAAAGGLRFAVDGQPAEGDAAGRRCWFDLPAGARREVRAWRGEVPVSLLPAPTRTP